MSASVAASGQPFNPTRFLKPALAIALSIASVVLIGNIPDLGIHAKVAFITFVVTIIAWTLTDLNDTYVALAGAIVFAATGIDDPAEFFETLGDPLVWLLFASFIIAAVIKASGLSERLATWVATRARNVSHLFILLTLVLVATTFLIPSTSGRAALMLPVFIAIRGIMPNTRAQIALALLFPAVILLSAIASLVGAGGHLITADILWRTSGEYIGFGRWMVMGLPFALASSFSALGVIMIMFLRPEDRKAPLLSSEALQATTKPWRAPERLVMFIAVGLIVLWATETVHGVNSTIIAIIGALIMTAPFINVISFKSALKEVDWSMLVFMATTLELGEALIESGGAQWLVERLFVVFDGGLAHSPLAVVAMVAIFGLLSHLVITSRSSRASVIIPLVILLAIALGFSPTTFAFMTAAATGFCLTLPVSAKPVAMFSKVDGATYSPRDLLRLSTVLLPIHVVLLVLFAFFFWPALGLDIAQARPTETPAAPTWTDRPEIGDKSPFGPIIDLGPNAFNPSGSIQSAGGDKPVGAEIAPDATETADPEASAEAASEAQEAAAEAAEEAQEAAEEAAEGGGEGSERLANANGQLQQAGMLPATTAPAAPPPASPPPPAPPIMAPQGSSPVSPASVVQPPPGNSPAAPPPPPPLDPEAAEEAAEEAQEAAEEAAENAEEGGDPAEEAGD
jgi:anion transporter